VSVREREDGGHDAEYDLLTAALIGATIGAGLTFMLRRGPSGRRPGTPIMLGMSRGAGWAGKHALRLGTRGARWAADRGEDLWDRVPRDEIREHVSDYIGRARETIDDAVESRLKTSRRTSRRCIPRSCSGNWRLAQLGGSPCVCRQTPSQQRDGCRFFRLLE